MGSKAMRCIDTGKEQGKEFAGVSKKLSFDEAFADAVEQLMGTIPPNRPALVVEIKVGAIAAALGGLAANSTAGLYATVSTRW
jgi:hypothetical protein